MIGIRADANETVATGHMMRCITIAKQLQALGEGVLFFLADEYPVPMLAAAGMDYICLHTVWNRMEEELPVLLTELKRSGCEKLLVDSYQATPAYLGGLRKEYKIIYIDDMFEAVYPVDMIINYNAYHIRFPYDKVYDSNTKLLLGTQYVPLREEFFEGGAIGAGEIKPRAAESLGEDGGKVPILLSCGGGDQYHALSGILEEAVKRDRLKEAVFHTIVGRFNQNVEGLEQLAKQHSQIRLYYDVPNMAELMSGCEIALSAAGTVLYELCAMQIPTVFFVCADNQKYDSDFFAEKSRMLFAGDIRTDRAGSIQQICNGMEELIYNAELRYEMKIKLHAVTDGKGAVRIAKALLNI